MVPKKSEPASNRGPKRPLGERITVRLGRSDVQLMDGLIAAGAFTTRSDVIKKALRDLLLSYADKLVDEQQKMKKLHEAAAIAQQMAEMQQK